MSEPVPFPRASPAYIAIASFALLAAQCEQTVYINRNLEAVCSVEVSPIVSPETRLTLSSRGARFADELTGEPITDYVVCDPNVSYGVLAGGSCGDEPIKVEAIEDPPCADCTYKFSAFGSEVAGEVAPIEDHWGRLVAQRVADLGAVADPAGPDDLGADFARFRDWCIYPETLVCQDLETKTTEPECPSENIADLPLPVCSPDRPAGRLRVACSPGVDTDCTSATIVTPPGEMATLEIELANDGQPGEPEIAVTEVGLAVGEGTPPGEFVLRDVPGEPSCDPDPYPGMDGIHLLTNPGVDPDRASCTMAIDFTPADSAPRAAQFFFTVADFVHTVAIEGVSPPGAVVAEPDSFCLELSQELCTEPGTVAITNAGPADVTVLAVELIEDDPTDLNLEFVPAAPVIGPGLTLEPGVDSLDLTLRSCGGATLSEHDTGTLEVTTDAAVPQPQLVVPIEVLAECDGS